MRHNGPPQRCPHNMDLSLVERVHGGWHEAAPAALLPTNTSVSVNEKHQPCRQHLPRSRASSFPRSLAPTTYRLVPVCNAPPPAPADFRATLFRTRSQSIDDVETSDRCSPRPCIAVSASKLKALNLYPIFPGPHFFSREADHGHSIIPSRFCTPSRSPNWPPCNHRSSNLQQKNRHTNVLRTRYCLLTIRGLQPNGPASTLRSDST